jgi:hypothetical protein
VGAKPFPEQHVDPPGVDRRATSGHRRWTTAGPQTANLPAGQAARILRDLVDDQGLGTSRRTCCSGSRHQTRHAVAETCTRPRRCPTISRRRTQCMGPYPGRPSAITMPRDLRSRPPASGRRRDVRPGWWWVEAGWEHAVDVGRHEVEVPEDRCAVHLEPSMSRSSSAWSPRARCGPCSCRCWCVDPHREVVRDAGVDDRVSTFASSSESRCGRQSMVRWPCPMGSMPPPMGQPITVRRRSPPPTRRPAVRDEPPLSGMGTRLRARPASSSASGRRARPPPVRPVASRRSINGSS